MKRSIARLLVATVAALSLLTFGGAAFTQAEHFVGEPTCRDIGTQVQCTGKIAGLGTTFTILVSAPGTATVECTNPAGNVAPGQTFDTTATGQSGPFPTPRNGQARLTVSTETPRRHWARVRIRSGPPPWSMWRSGTPPSRCWRTQRSPTRSPLRSPSQRTATGQPSSSPAAVAAPVRALRRRQGPS
jgi:hypothetical protein